MQDKIFDRALCLRQILSIRTGYARLLNNRFGSDAPQRRIVIGAIDSGVYRVYRTKHRRKQTPSYFCQTHRPYRQIFLLIHESRREEHGNARAAPFDALLFPRRENVTR